MAYAATFVLAYGLGVGTSIWYLIAHKGDEA
jgi:hypothetical protein